MEGLSEKTCPHHLCGAKTIARMFGVGRKTVAEWKDRGAPIVYVGKKYQANYSELWRWLKVNIPGFHENLSSVQSGS